MLSGAVVLAALWYLEGRDQREPSKLAFVEHCASCHAPGGSAVDLLALDSPVSSANELTQQISNRHSELIEDAALPEPMVKALALYMIEQRFELPSIVDSHICSPSALDVCAVRACRTISKLIPGYRSYAEKESLRANEYLLRRKSVKDLKVVRESLEAEKAEFIAQGNYEEVSKLTKITDQCSLVVSNL